MRPDLVRWIVRFLLVYYDTNDSTTTEELRRTRFQDDDDNTDNTTNRDNFTDPVRYYGEFMNTFEADVEARRRRFEEVLLHLVMARGPHHANRIRRRAQTFNQFRSPRSRWFASGRTSAWWINLRDGWMPATAWKRNLRMSETQFYKLLTLFGNSLDVGDGPNYRAIQPARKLAFFLYFLAHKGGLQMSANSFGLSHQVASTIVSKVSRLICEKIQPLLVHMPWTDDLMKEKVCDFEAKFGLPGVFGAIDGSHFRIKEPNSNHTEYLNYKGFHSINVQAICDSHGYFLDVYAKHPGRCHDARMFQMSPASTWLEKGMLGSFTDFLPDTPNYLLGDPGYYVLPYMMTEFTLCSSVGHNLFNILLRSARNVIERAFGRLKARWRYVSGKMEIALEGVPDLIISAFVLHNFLESPLYRENANASHLNGRAYHKVMDKEQKNIINYGHGPKDALSSVDLGKHVRKRIVAYIDDVKVQAPPETSDPIVPDLFSSDSESEFELDHELVEKCRQYAEESDSDVDVDFQLE